MTISLNDGKWENLQEISAAALERELKPQATTAMKAALVLFEGEIKKTLTGRRSGRAYRVSKTGALHIASAPGEPPAVLFDNLRGSVGHSGPTWKGATVEGEVGIGLGQAPGGGSDPSDTYARRLELGGADSRGVVIEPRPYIAPTADRVEPMITQLFNTRLGS